METRRVFIPSAVQRTVDEFWMDVFRSTFTEEVVSALENPAVKVAFDEIEADPDIDTKFDNFLNECNRLHYNQDVAYCVYNHYHNVYKTRHACTECGHEGDDVALAHENMETGEEIWMCAKCELGM